MKSETSSDIPARRASVTESVKGDGFSFAVTVGFHPNYGSPLEVFLTQRGKCGSPLETTLYDLGVTASKMMQDYDTSGTKIRFLEEERLRLLYQLAEVKEENFKLSQLLQCKNLEEDTE
tara:strand:+ start:102 stop:458 length:357 start_codon:yes stop_codon:yes gene_type:complete